MGEGEKLPDFDVFVPSRMAERILGMGDVVGLVEKAAEVIDEEEAMRMANANGEELLRLQRFSRADEDDAEDGSA